VIPFSTYRESLIGRRGGEILAPPSYSVPGSPQNNPPI
jgi:hypothetical protein